MKELDYTYEDSWIRRESNLKEITYREYLNSDWWRTIKKKAESRPETYGKCQFCGCSANIDLHHTSYKWIFTSRELSVIIPLCREHHYEVHQYAKDNKVSVRVATNKLRKVYRPDWIGCKR